MKRKDIGLILIIVVVSAVISFIASNSLFGTSKAKQQSAPVVEAISSDFSSPDTHYFNKDAYDPTQIIKIGQSDNPDPFSGN